MPLSLMCVACIGSDRTLNDSFEVGGASASHCTIFNLNWPSWKHRQPFGHRLLQSHEVNWQQTQLGSHISTPYSQTKSSVFVEGNGSGSSEECRIVDTQVTWLWSASWIGAAFCDVAFRSHSVWHEQFSGFELKIGSIGVYFQTPTSNTVGQRWMSEQNSAHLQPRVDCDAHLRILIELVAQTLPLRSVSIDCDWCSGVRERPAIVPQGVNSENCVGAKNCCKSKSNSNFYYLQSPQSWLTGST
jgi:hypothetical protein